MRNPFRKKPPKLDIIVMHDHPCPSCGLADYRKVPRHPAGDIVECVNCKTQWLLLRLVKNGYTSGKGR